MPSEEDRQGSGLSRREALRVMGAASALPLLHPALARRAIVGDPAGASWQPRFLDPKDVEAVASLSDCIIPGTKDRAVHEYIDFALSRSEPTVQSSFSEGLSWLGSYVVRSMRRDVTFAELNREQQHALLAAISDTSHAHEPQGYAFFTQVKQLTIEGYYHC